LEILILFVVDC